MLEDGRLYLSGIAKLAPVLTEANCDALLARATHKTKRQIEELVAEVAPKPDVASTMRKIPVRRETSTTAPAAESRPNGVETSPVADAPLNVEAPTSPVPASRPAPVKPAVIEPLAPSRFRVQFTASAELHAKLERLVALMPGSDLASVVEVAVTEKLARVEAKRFGKTNKPKKSVEQADKSPGSRYIPAPVRRLVWTRDRGRCTDLSPNGRRCTARDGLEYHHDDPYAFGGDRTPENIRLLCKIHNALRGERDFGKEVMDPYRRSDDRVFEPLPVYYESAESLRVSLRPDAVKNIAR